MCNITGITLSISHDYDYLYGIASTGMNRFFSRASFANVMVVPLLIISLYYFQPQNGISSDLPPMAYIVPVKANTELIYPKKLKEDIESIRKVVKKGYWNNCWVVNFPASKGLEFKSLPINSFLAELVSLMYIM
ncbi:hypothetical protein Glove_33g55 [Diversispora epigaea]|uniref:Uncharacterized protein n=1 Tax=Diversispora epigaea TaxID=1348612 RepID=A0A397JNT8_9GLOM|nr:hypothetical protein Glove_33g55 [Diversispora epigaea]